MKKALMNDELKGLSPFLHDLRQQDDGFQMPEGYLEALETSVFDRIDAMEARRQPVLGAKRGGSLLANLFRPQAIAAVAATLALVLAAAWFFRSQSPAADSTAPPFAQELTEEEIIESYVLENIRDFDAEQLAALSHEKADIVPAAQPENDLKNRQSIDGLSEEELELLIKEMSSEELESLL